jgi:hypothetical protein
MGPSIGTEVGLDGFGWWTVVSDLYGDASAVGMEIKFVYVFNIGEGARRTGRLEMMGGLVGMTGSWVWRDKT